MKKYRALTSSQNPEQIANKVKGAILLASSVVIFLAAKLFGITLSANDVTALTTEVGAVAGAVWVIYGSILHLVAALAERKNA